MQVASRRGVLRRARLKTGCVSGARAGVGDGWRRSESQDGNVVEIVEGCLTKRCGEERNDAVDGEKER